MAATRVKPRDKGLTHGRGLALERMLKEDAILYPQYREHNSRNVIIAKSANKPFSFERTDTAYSKKLDFLPSTWKWADLKQVCGKTVVVNSWIDQGGGSSLAQRGITFTNNNDGSYTYSGTCSSDLTNARTFQKSGSSPGVKVGEKWFVRMRGNPGILFGVNGAGSGNYTADEYKIQTITVASTNTGIGCTYKAGVTYNGTVYPLLVNLTTMFGAGNEPTDADEVNAMFPDNYYPYTAGTLKNAVVTSIVSKDADAVTLDTYTIPDAVQALAGYGWSAGNTYNYIDFKQKVYVQNVGSRAYISDDATDSTVTTDGTTTYYKLTTPVETDISTYLVDNELMTVEYDGTLTFTNTNKIPVTSNISYNRRQPN